LIYVKNVNALAIKTIFGIPSSLLRSLTKVTVTRRVMTEQATPLPTATPATSGPLQPSAQSAAEGAAIYNHFIVILFIEGYVYLLTLLVITHVLHLKQTTVPDHC